MIVIFYLINIHNINKVYYEQNNTEEDVMLRTFPYPFKAALTISSDIDNTETI